MKAKNLYNENQLSLRKRSDRAFGWLMLAQWLIAIVIDVTTQRSLNYHVLVIALLGAAISTLPLYFAFIRPGKMLAGYIVAIAQMGFSALYIYILGGNSESHFHIFVSLAFLSAYRNWRILAVAAAIAICDHFFRGIYFPISMYGFSENTEWLWLKHSVWIIIEALFLGYLCIQHTQEMKQTSFTHSELMTARLAAENLNYNRAQFFSVISHEIRTPLSGIIGFSEFLKDSPIPPEQKEYASIIQQCSETLLKLVNDLLDFNRIDSGRLDLDPHTFKVAELREYLVNIFSLECQKKSLSFNFDISSDIPRELIGDSHRIRQVLTNLISNAIKFTESGGIQVQLTRQDLNGNIFCWTVIDSGVGIKKDNLVRIFSPYTQEYSSTARKYGGSGLGLAISKKLVELMGGQLSVESTLGKGTRLFFTTPLAYDSNISTKESYQ